MPGSRDKRRRRDLDLFVLALIENGVTTPYGLQIGAGVSPGASIPALRRLVTAGWASAGKPGSRGRTDHMITAAGRRHLQGGWRELIEEGPTGDADADLRIALLALFVGGDRRIAADFLRGSAKKKHSTLAVVHAPEGNPDQPLLACWYQRLRSEFAKTVVQAEAAGILHLARLLPAKRKAKRRSK